MGFGSSDFICLSSWRSDRRTGVTLEGELHVDWDAGDLDGVRLHDLLLEKMLARECLSIDLITMDSVLIQDGRRHSGFVIWGLDRC